MNFLTLVFLSALLFFPHPIKAKEGAAIPFHLNQNTQGPKPSPVQLSQQVEAQLFELTNELRQKKKLPILKGNDTLVKIARDHSQDMLKRNYLSHFSPEGKSVVDRTKKYVKELRTSLGENLHMIQSSEGLQDPNAIATQMMEDWTRSASHRKNLLGKEYSQLGVGCQSDGQLIYCTQVFSGKDL